MRKLHYALIGISVFLGSMTGIIFVGAQESSTDKMFTKDFCFSENNLLDDILYPDSGQLSYDSSGCPTSTKVIHRWNELSVSQKNIVTTRMTTNGYIEGDEINSFTGEVVN